VCKLPKFQVAVKLVATMGTLFVFSGAFATALGATTRYVSTTGVNAGNDCTNASNACATIVYAISQSDPGDTVQVAAGTYTEHGITVNKDLTISGHSAYDTIVQAAATQAAANDRVFLIASGNTVTISRLTIRNGNAPGSSGSFPPVGSGIWNDHATLTVSDCAITNNSALNNAEAGGIWNDGESGGSATLTINNSTVSGNSALTDAGGILNDGRAGSATLTINNSTISGNSVAAGSGGGIVNSGTGGSATLTINNSTVSGNSSANGSGGIESGAGSFAGVPGNAALTIKSSTFSGNSFLDTRSTAISGSSATVTVGATILNSGVGIANFGGTVTSLGYNLSSGAGVANSSGGTGALNATGDQTNTNPMLGPRAYYGGPTATHILLTGSPAIDKGKNLSGATNDQRGFARTVGSAAAPGGDGTDIGAFERQPSDIDPTLLVTTTDDTNANNTCNPANPCSLRDAITAANASASDDVIYFAVTGAITLNANGALPNLDSNMKILGPGANVLAVKRDSAAPALFRIFAINTGKTDTISGLTISGGRVTGPGGDIRGGGIYNFHANLTLNNCAVSGNSADSGGGIENDGTLGPPDATLTVNNSTISGNSVGTDGFGGGINNEAVGARATLTINDSTISGNSAGGGGGIENDYFGGGGGATLTVNNSTISGNSVAAGFGGGIANLNTAATVDLTSTILNTGASGENIFNAGGVVTSHGYNLSSDDASAFLNQSTDKNSTDPMLGPLLDNGGPTFTHALLPNSPAIDKGKNATATTADQRGSGFERTFDKLIANATGGDGTDIGAFEVQNVAPTISGATISRVQGGPNSNSQIATVSDDHDQSTALTVTVNSSNPSNGVTVSGISVDGFGNVTATVAASCSASNTTFILRVTDTGGFFAEATLTVNVTANTAPTLTYSNASVANSGSTTINPATGPSDNGTVASIVLQSPGTYTGTISVNNGTGVVSISNASPMGSHTITIRATDNCGLTKDATFTLNVTNNAPTITAGSAVTRQQGSAGASATIATVSDADQSAGSLTVTAATIPSGISVTGITNNSGTITATVGADCSAKVGANTVVLTVTDSNGGSSTTNFTVNVTANTAPILSYNNASVAYNGSITINPATGPSDNVSVASVVLQSQGTYTGTITVNSAGVVSISHAAPAGSHTITIRATDNCNVTTDATFTLNVAASIPAKALNISTRLRVDTGDKVMIGGFIITGTVPKPVVLRGLGPSLVNVGIPAASVLNDPVIELHGDSGAVIVSNDNWKDNPENAQIKGTVFEPSNDREAVIVTTLPPATYTVVLKGVGGTSGVGLIELYDRYSTLDSDLANISTRGFVMTQENVMIGGFMLGANPDGARIAIRGLGPSLASSGLTNLLADPTLELHNGNGALLISNDNWQDDPVSASQLTANGLAPRDSHEAAIFTTLPPGSFTAILAGKNGGIGIGLVEIYNVK
jgi:CSLREA domain-containing protein